MLRTTKGTPQLNGVAERMKKNLNERARCMSLKCELPKRLWADVMNTVVYFINRGP